MPKWPAALASALLLFGVDTVASASVEVTPASEAKMLQDVELSGRFHTLTSWRYLVTQDPDHPDPGFPSEMINGITACFIHGHEKKCDDYESTDLGSVYIAPSAIEAKIPLFIVNYHTMVGNGNNNDTIVYKYRRDKDRFEKIYERICGPNNNEESRVVSNGPLAGDLILSIAPRRAPYRYKIEVFRLTKTGKFSPLLNFIGNSRYQDGNGLAVIDAEMPEIEKRLHFWKMGDGLPVPARMHNECKAPYLHDGLEWCE